MTVRERMNYNFLDENFFQLQTLSTMSIPRNTALIFARVPVIICVWPKKYKLRFSLLAKTNKFAGLIVYGAYKVQLKLHRETEPLVNFLPSAFFGQLISKFGENCIV